MDKILKNSECAIEKKGKLIPETGTLRVFGRGFSVDPKHCRKACPVRDKALWRRGQQILEYAIVIAAVSTALTVMYVYTKRGLQASIRDLADTEIGGQMDSQPIVDVSAHQSAVGVASTLTNDSMTVRKTYHEALYASNSISTSQGTSTTVFNQME